MLGDKAQTFRRLPFSLLLQFTGKQLFSSLLLLLLVAVCMVEKCSATGIKTSSYRTYATFREKVV